MAGAGGAAGTGGTGGSPRVQIPGLWAGAANGFKVCFHIGPNGLELSASVTCDVNSDSVADENSFDLGVDQVGTDENGERCSFGLRFTERVSIDQETNSFGVVGFQPPGEDVVLSFSGEIVGEQASGVARSESGGSFCQVGWAAKPVAPCDEAAIQTCLALQTCCESILINPVYFRNCNSVVLECNQARCQALLDGYPSCAPSAPAQ